MGLPQNPSSSSSSNASLPTSYTANNTSTPASTAASLPPEAIALATKLFHYARVGATAELLQYVAAGVPPNLTNDKGDTLLMLAAYHGHAATVRGLLERGADPDVLNERGQSPLAGAVFKGHDEVVGLLVRGLGPGAVGADVYAGQPNAVDAARMFRKEDYLVLFGVEA